MTPKHDQEFVANDPNGGDWYKSSYSVSNSHCVEARKLSDGRLAVRDSKNIGPILTFEVKEWHSFMAGVRRGEFGSPPGA
jgi:hypothetical protein